MRARFRRAGDLAHIDAACQQGVGDQRSMASPGHRFRAHQRDLFCVRQLDTAIQALLEFTRLHVIRVAAEAGIPPTRVRGISARTTQTPEAWHVRVVDAGLLERCGQLLAAELWIVPGLWDRSNVDQALHAVRGQQMDELVDWSSRVADSEDRHST